MQEVNIPPEVQETLQRLLQDLNITPVPPVRPCLHVGHRSCALVSKDSLVPRLSTPPVFDHLQYAVIKDWRCRRSGNKAIERCHCKGISLTWIWLRSNVFNPLLHSQRTLASLRLFSSPCLSPMPTRTPSRSSRAWWSGSRHTSTGTPGPSAVHSRREAATRSWIR